MSLLITHDRPFIKQKARGLLRSLAVIGQKISKEKRLFLSNQKGAVALEFGLLRSLAVIGQKISKEKRLFLSNQKGAVALEFGLLRSLAVIGQKISKEKRLFLSTQKGAVALEFGLLLPALLYFLFGILEISMIIMAQNLIDLSTREASRYSRTGDIVSGSSRNSEILSVMNKYLAFLNPTQLTVNVRSYANLTDFLAWAPASSLLKSSTSISANDPGTSAYGSANQYVIYTAHYQWRVLTPFLAPLIATSGASNTPSSVDLYSTAIYQNEPYGH